MQSIKEKSFEKDSTRNHVKLYQSTAKMHWLFTRHRGTPDLTFNITFSLTQSWMVIWICFLSFPNYDRLVASMAPHSSTLAWKIPWTEEPGGLQSMGLLRVGHDWVTSPSLFPFMHWRRKWQPTPVFLPGESQGRGSLVGCCLWGRTESDTTEVTWHSIA